MAPQWRNIAWLVSDYFSRKSSLTAYQAIPNHRSKIDTFVFALPPGASPWSFQQPQPTIGKWSWDPPRHHPRHAGLCERLGFSLRRLRPQDQCPAAEV
jgi:hypothetical protein